MNTEHRIISDLIFKYLELEKIADFGDSYDKILDRLQPQIQYLLDNNFQLLLNALYRIDVDEVKFREVLELGDPEMISRNVSILILDRVILKAQTRLKYQQ